MKCTLAGLAAVLFGALATTAAAGYDPMVPQAAENMQIIGHSDLNGVGKGGEGLALKQYAGGRRVLFLAHESAPMCFSEVDVTDPTHPKVIVQVPTETAFIRCNSLSLAGDVLAVAHQTAKAGEPGAGLDLYDIHDPAHPTKLSHFDTSGPHSRGVHYVWFTDGHYAYLSTGARDFTPRNPKDDQFLMIVDVSDPRHPHEVGPLVAAGHSGGGCRRCAAAHVLAGRRHPHALADDPGEPAQPRLCRLDRRRLGDPGHLRQGPSARHRAPFAAFDRRGVHPYGGGDPLARDRDPERGGDQEQVRRLAEAQLGLGHPQRDAIRSRSRRSRRSRMRRRCATPAGGSVSHNIDMNRPMPFSRTLTETVVGSYFDGGVRAYSIADPSHPVEIGYLIPAAPPGNATHTIQINDVYVDEHGLIYANDRLSGGLYIIRYTGKVPLR